VGFKYDSDVGFGIPELLKRFGYLSTVEGKLCNVKMRLQNIS